MLRAENFEKWCNLAYILISLLSQFLTKTSIFIINIKIIHLGLYGCTFGMVYLAPEEMFLKHATTEAFFVYILKEF